MDVSSLRLDTLNIRVEPCKQFTAPDWAVPGNSVNTGAALHVIKNGEVVDTLKIDDSRLFTVFGRCPSSSSSNGVCVILEHPSVSRVHAAVLRGKEDLIYVIDLGSSHGTYVSGKRIEPFSAVALHDRSVIVFGQSSRRYIVRIFPKEVSSCMDAEEANTLINCMVGYKQQSPAADDKQMMDDLSLPKMERRVSFSCLAPEIIPSLPSRPTPLPQDGSSTPLGIMGGSPEVTWTRKSIVASPRLCLPETAAVTSRVTRQKSDSLPSIQAQSGSDEDEEVFTSMESGDLSPQLHSIDETKEVFPHENLSIYERKNFFKRLPAKIEAFTKRLRPENL